MSMHYTPTGSYRGVEPMTRPYIYGVSESVKYPLFTKKRNLPKTWKLRYLWSRHFQSLRIPLYPIIGAPTTFSGCIDDPASTRKLEPKPLLLMLWVVLILHSILKSISLPLYRAKTEILLYLA